MKVYSQMTTHYSSSMYPKNFIDFKKGNKYVIIDTVFLWI